MSPYLNSVSDFTVAAKKKGYFNRIKPGKYAIHKGSNNNEIINSLRSKNLTIKVTFNNQERLENLAGRVAEQIAPDSITLIRAFRDTNFLKQNGKVIIKPDNSGSSIDVFAANDVKEIMVLLDIIKELDDDNPIKALYNSRKMLDKMKVNNE